MDFINCHAHSPLSVAGNVECDVGLYEPVSIEADRGLCN